MVFVDPHHLGRRKRTRETGTASSFQRGNHQSPSFSYQQNRITPYSSGIVLSSQNIFNIDEEGKTCPGYTARNILKYPSGWQMTQVGSSQDLNSVMWNAYTFTNGASGRQIGE